jgi:hypothetical protein
MAGITRPMHLAQGAAQRINFAFVSVLLALKYLEHFKDFLHVLKSISESIHDRIYFFNGLLDRSGWSRPRRRGHGWNRGDGRFRRCLRGVNCGGFLFGRLSGLLSQLEDRLGFL